MLNFNSIKVITDNNLCISCGSCTHICPFDNILMEFSESRGKWDAIVQNTDACLQCNGEQNCLYVCPSYETDYTQFGSEENNLIGKVENIYNGYSGNELVRNSASSGGFIRELCRSLLEQEVITGVISITHDDGLEYTPENITDISLMPNSIYHNINFEKAFDIIKKEEGKFLIIGLPCQLTGIELLLNKKKFASLEDKIYLKVALICGYTFDRINMDYFSKSNSFDMKEITYREDGRYRKTRIINNSESVLFDVYNPKTVNEKINNMLMFDKWLPQDNCLFCVDHIGYSADLVVGDAWQKRYKDDNIGTNIIISRTKKAEEAIMLINNFTVEKGFINEIEESQGKYANPMFGRLNSKENVTKKFFVPNHKVSDDIKVDNQKIELKDKIKVKYVKQLLSRKKYILAKVLYVACEYKVFVKIIIKKIILGKI